MRKFELNFGIKEHWKQPITYIEILLVLCIVIGTFYSISLSFRTLDDFFPSAISIVPGIFAIIMTLFVPADVNSVEVKMHYQVNEWSDGETEVGFISFIVKNNTLFRKF